MEMFDDDVFFKCSEVFVEMNSVQGLHGYHGYVYARTREDNLPRDRQHKMAAEDDECQPRDSRQIELRNRIIGTKLDLSDANLSGIPDYVYEARAIEFMYLKGNKLCNLPGKFMLHFCLLKWLDLRNNQLTSLPAEISLLKGLNTLLLEGNKLIALPLQLGTLRNVSGLSLAGNPLTCPPSDVISKGTQAVLQYLRDQLGVEDRLSSAKLSDDDEHVVYVDERNSDVQTSKQTACQHQPQCCMSPVHRADSDSRRRSLDHRWLAPSIPYNVTPLTMNERLKLPPPYAPSDKERRASAPVKKSRVKPMKSATGSTASGASVRNADRSSVIENRLREDTAKAKMKEANEKIDATLQKQKDGQALDNWRKEARNRQRSKKVPHKIPNAGIDTPYGTDMSAKMTDALLGKHSADVASALQGDDKASAALRFLRDKNLEARIQEHAEKIRNWKRSEKVMTVGEELLAARDNLEKALQLQKSLDEKRAVEYRLRAFTAGDYTPAAHRSPSNS